jgi:hypothetical protein
VHFTLSAAPDAATGSGCASCSSEDDFEILHTQYVAGMLAFAPTRARKTTVLGKIATALLGLQQLCSVLGLAR